MSEALGEASVPEEHLGAPADLCPVCGRFGERRAVARLQADPPVHLVACDACGAASADRFPDEPFLKSLYAPDRYASDLLSSARALRRCAARIARHVPLERARDLRVLDYGGGDGGLARTLAAELRALGHRGAVDCTVVDYFVDERSAAGVRALDLATFERSRDTYDLVLASAVLEHLTDLPGTAARLLRACRPAGFFYARTPYELPLARVLPGYRLRWPRHLHDLGPAFWAGFLARSGFRGQALRSAPSVVESDFATRPLRTLAAQLLKGPGELEARLFPRRVGERGHLLWPFVGGWEVVLRIDGPLEGAGRGSERARGSALRDEQHTPGRGDD